MDHPVRDAKPASRSAWLLFMLLFIGAALAFTIWSYQRIPHHVLLHINDMWQIHLVGERNIANVVLPPQRMTITARDTANLWLQGTGTITWQTHRIRVHQAGIYLDQHGFSKNDSEPVVNILFYPDGRVQKGPYSAVPSRSNP